MKRQTILSAFALLLLSAPQVTALEKPTTPQAIPQIAVAVHDLPFHKEVTLKPGGAYRLLLPDRQDVAVWCRQVASSGAERLLNPEDLLFDYGEKPFQERPIRFRQRLGDSAGMAVCESVPGAIRGGGVITWTGGPGHEEFFFVGNYRVALREERVREGKLPIKIHVRVATNSALEDLLVGEESKEYFLPRLRAKDPATRTRAITKLLEYVSYEGLEANFERRHLHPAGRAIREAIDTLREDTDAKVRAAAEIALCRLGDEAALMRFLTPFPPGEFCWTGGGTEVALWCCNGGGEKAAKHTLAFLDSPNEKLVLFALGFFSTYNYDAAGDKLLGTLTHPSPLVRLDAVRELKRNERARKMFPAVLSKLFRDADPVIRSGALTWAGDWLPSAEWTRELAEQVMGCLKDKEATVRAAAASCVARSRNPKAIEALLAVSDDPPAHVRGAAAAALGQVGSDKAYTPLVMMLAGDSPEVRAQTALGLRSLNRLRAIAPLRQRLREEKVEDVRWHIEFAIRMIELNAGS